MQILGAIWLCHIRLIKSGLKIKILIDIMVLCFCFYLKIIYVQLVLFHAIKSLNYIFLRSSDSESEESLTEEDFNSEGLTQAFLCHIFLERRISSNFSDVNRKTTFFEFLFWHYNTSILHVLGTSLLQNFVITMN